MSAHRSQIAEYFLVALHRGVARPEEAREWAFRIIEVEQDALGELVDVALSKDAASLEAALKAIGGPRDKLLAGKSVLQRISEHLLSGTYETKDAILVAMHTCQGVGLSQDLYYELDAMNENLEYARDTGTAKENDVRMELTALLGRFGSLEKGDA